MKATGASSLRREYDNRLHRIDALYSCLPQDRGYSPCAAFAAVHEAVHGPKRTRRSATVAAAFSGKADMANRVAANLRPVDDLC